MVSSYMMTPLTNAAAPGVVKSSSRYRHRLCSVERIFSASNRFVSVATDSSAARMPLPSATSVLATVSRSCTVMSCLPWMDGSAWTSDQGGRIPPFERGNSAVVAQDVQCSGVEQEVLAGARRQPEPARRQDTQDVPVGEERDVAGGGARPRDHVVDPRGDVGRCLP